VREDAKQQLSEAAQRLHYERERGEANEVRLLRLIDQARSDHTAERSRLDTALKKSQQREADIQEQLTSSRKEQELLRVTLAGADESNRLLKIELEQTRTVQREMEAAHLQTVRQVEYLRGELEVGTRERQALELALRYCHQALQACQQPPSPPPEEKPSLENDGNKPGL